MTTTRDLKPAKATSLMKRQEPQEPQEPQSPELAHGLRTVRGVLCGRPAYRIGALLSVLSAFVGIELVRTMWMWTQPGEPTSGLLGMLGGMFGK